MKRFGSVRIKSLILALILTVQAVCLCCVFVACASAHASTSPAQDKAAEPAAASVKGGSPAENYSRWLSVRYSDDVMTRARWLRDLMTTLGLVSDNASRDDAALFVAAHGAGLIDSPDACRYASLTRDDVATTLYRALGYSPRTVGELADVNADDVALHTLVYYGYFLPDHENCVHPEAAVSAAEYDDLLQQVRYYTAMKGKHILSFGDSIMYGSGNDGEGLADMIAEKYGMTATDYAVAGAHFGTYPKFSHIPSQIRKAIEVGEMADIILINGSTNDMLHTVFGQTVSGYDLTLFEEKSFSGGMQMAFALLQQYREGVPVLYIRAHNMQVCDDVVERRYGEHALEIAAKWSAACVDIFSDTSFNSEVRSISDRYTRYVESLGRSDTAHPTALGYAKFYLPAVGEQMAALLSDKEVTAP